MNTPPAWLKRLCSPGRRLLQDGRGRYAVYPGGDRRRRPLARISAEAFRQARASGLICETGEGWALSGPGRAALDRVTQTGVDHAAPKRVMARRELRGETGRSSFHAVNLAESPLHRWAGMFEAWQVEAGERYRRDYLGSTLSAIGVSDWLRPPGGASSPVSCGPDSAPIARLDARQRVLDARDALGAQMSRLADAVLVEEEGLAALERRFGWPSRSGSGLVRIVLTRLGEIYGLAPVSVPMPVPMPEPRPKPGSAAGKTG